MNIQQILTWLLSVGFGAVVYWLMEHVPALADMSPRWKRFASVVVLPITLACLAFGAALASGYQAASDDWQGIVTGLMVYIVTAISQVLHGQRKLPNS